MYEKTDEIRHSLNCLDWSWKSIDSEFGRSTIWKVGDTRYGYIETSEGFTRFYSDGISPDWAVTLSME